MALIRHKRFTSPDLSEIDKLRQPLTDGEKIVLNFFLENLPSDWEIYIQPHLNGLRPDFVLLSPQKGIAVYEVKDWNLAALNYFYKERGNATPILMASDGVKTFSMAKNDPIVKIEAYRNEIYELYCPNLPDKKGFGVVIGGVIFPFASKSQIETLMQPYLKIDNFKDNLNRHPIISSESLNSSNIKDVLSIVYRKDERINEKIANDLRHWLIEPDFSSEQRTPLLNELDSRQRELVLTRTATGYRRIKGPAGSGKSLVLAGRAAKLASEGKSVLLVTFNITLINYLLDLAVRFEMNGKVRNQITALNFHHWCKRSALLTGHMDEYNNLWGMQEPNQVLERSLAIATMEWLEQLNESDKFDAILVDEGQDFQQEWWASLRMAVKQKGEMLLCADRAQNVYGVLPWTEQAMKSAGFHGDWMSLENSYRLSPSLCKLASSFIELFLPNSENPRPLPPQGEIEFHTELKWIQTQSHLATCTCADELINIVTKSNPAISYADLTCIVETSQSGKLLVAELMRRKINCIHTFGDGERESRRKKLAFFKGDARVKVTTIHSFKGWEASALVLLITSSRSIESMSLVYAGITRLKKLELGCYLTVVCCEPKLEYYGKSWPVFVS